MSTKRFFKTGNASRRYRKDGFVFDFEPLFFSGGSWLGTLVVDDGKQAESLAKFGPPVYEIEEAEYEELKKKLNSNNLVSSQPQPQTNESESSEPESAPSVAESLESELGFSKVKEDSDIPEEAKPKNQPMPQEPETFSGEDQEQESLGLED
jgi:hypothetical protein